MKTASLTHNNKLPYCLCIVIGALIFIPYLGGVHLFDWDEINFAESAREMLVTHNYLTVQINYEPFWEKPPLFIWLQALSMHIFGINEFAARFPNAVCGILSLLFLLRIGQQLYHIRFGIIWGLTYLGSILPHLYFRSGIIDPYFNLFIFSAFYYFIKYAANEKKQIRLAALSAFLIGLAMLTKGPVGLLLFGLSIFIFLILQKFRIKIPSTHILIFTSLLIFTGGFWFLLQIMSGNFNIIKDFIIYQIRLFSTHDAGHSGFFGYHIIVLFLGVFPASLFALSAFFSKRKMETSLFQQYFKQGMLILFFVVLILFSIVQTKIVHYSSLCYFPLTFLSAYTLHHFLEGHFRWKSWLTTLLIGVSVLITLLIFAVQWIGLHPDTLRNSGLIQDPFANENLSAKVHWTGFEFLIGLFFLIGIIFSITYFKKEAYLKKYVGIFMSTLLLCIGSIYIFVPKIERYSQHTAIAFYKEKSKENCYVDTYGFKSYAKYFYFKKPLTNTKNASNTDSLLQGTIDKPVYFVAKNTSKEDLLDNHKNLQLLFEKNGFIFFIRPLNITP